MAICSDLSRRVSSSFPVSEVQQELLMADTAAGAPLPESLFIQVAGVVANGGAPERDRVNLIATWALRSR